jgi:hypothetical protein
MKLVKLFAVVAATVIFSSCDNGTNNTSEVVDTTATAPVETVVDSAAAVVDTTTAPVEEAVKADSTK